MKNGWIGVGWVMNEDQGNLRSRKQHFFKDGAQYVYPLFGQNPKPRSTALGEHICGEEAFLRK